MTNAQPRPLPTPQPESDFYWQKAKDHELWLMRCKDCNQNYFYPRAICPNCFSRNTEWFQSSGKGTLYSFAIVERAPTPAFAGMVPFVTAFVELEGGVRMASNLVEVEPKPENIKIGMPVEVVFEDVNDTISLPTFRPV